MSAAQFVREQIEAAPTRSFIATGDVAGSRRAVECELSRLASAGEVVRVRRGLYWKGPRTRLGMPLPRPDEVALAVAGPGAGPARLSAAARLGLTTQVPAVDTIAVAGRSPTAPAATRFVSRSVERRIRDLTPTEVAVIEVLREGPDLLEVPWGDFAAAVTRLAASGELRYELITEQLGDEHHVAARDRWRSLAQTLEHELVPRRRYRTRDQARADIAARIDTWSNRRRLHSTNNMTSPIEYEPANAA